MKETGERYWSVWLPHYQQHCLVEGDLNRQVAEEILKQELLEGPHGILSELRNCVDELVMIEVQNLQAKMKSEKKPKKKSKKAPKPKKLKLRDPTKGVDLETSTNTLVYENKWQLVPVEVRLQSFVGPDNLMASPLGQIVRQQRPDEEITKKWQRILRNWNDSVEAAMGGVKKEAFEKLFEAYMNQSTWLKEPSAAQIRRAATEYGILPLGSQVIHDLTTQKNALLFYGLPASGKTTMAYAICNESGANFFNLSPANFSSTKGIPKIVQLVFYVARIMGPSIIYMDNIEKVFPAKGTSKKKDPLALRGKKIKKEILKGLNTMQPSDRVLLVATTCEPWMADRDTLVNVFPHALWFPSPDYATRISLLRHFVLSKIPPGQERNAATNDARSPFLYEQLALLTEGWTTGQLKRMVDKTLIERRIEQLIQRPLQANDFVVALAEEKARSKEEDQKMIEFQNSIPYTMRRANPPEDFPEEESALGKSKKTSVRKSRA
ncbi:unnamed protein product [Phytomonas sp. EM1]|nr:unnamed protein product [Phytomonas sp. EM1]|eukprot:CCW61799.1 unnamed protein product [Phytomonas sp. isolate EM1]